jgi:hypothetical protein
MNDKLWPVVDKDTPCPICRKIDWCALGDLRVKCMRVTSGHPSKDGGWYHHYPNSELIVPIVKKARVVRESANVNFERMISLCDTSYFSLENLSLSLGVAQFALQNLNCKWWRDTTWAFPMSDGEGKVIGIRLRNEAGQKWAVRGSRQGIFLPDIEPEPTAYLPEGPTDTAACLTIGLYAIGRPNCNQGAELLKIAVKRLGVRRIVILADRDEPGQRGARSIAKELEMNHVIWTPPTKDIREFVKRGGTKHMVENAIRQIVWKK